MSEIHQYKLRNGSSPAWYDEGTGPTPDAWHLDCVQPDHIWRTVYQQGYAAALSQPAGVLDGWKLVPVEPTEVMCEAAMSSLGWTRSEAAAKTAPITPASPMMEGSMKVWSAMLAAAPAASGVDTSTNEAWAARAQEKIEAMDAASGGEACGCIYYGLGKAAPYLCEMHKARKADPHPPPAASVSERARDDRFTAMLIGIIADVQDALGFTDEDKECSNGSLEIVAAIRELKEQALTQQRGHGEAVDRDAWAEALELPEGYTVEEFLPGGWHYAWTRADGERMVSGTTWNHPALAAIAAWKYAPDTTPQTSADAVRELVKRWRECAKSAANGPMFDGASEYAVAGTYIDCADELESLLSGGPHA